LFSNHVDWIKFLLGPLVLEESELPFVSPFALHPIIDQIEGTVSIGSWLGEGRDHFLFQPERGGLGVLF